MTFVKKEIQLLKGIKENLKHEEMYCIYWLEYAFYNGDNFPSNYSIYPKQFQLHSKNDYFSVKMYKLI